MEGSDVGKGVQTAFGEGVDVVVFPAMGVRPVAIRRE